MLTKLYYSSWRKWVWMILEQVSGYRYVARLSADNQRVRYMRSLRQVSRHPSGWISELTCNLVIVSELMKSLSERCPSFANWCQCIRLVVCRLGNKAWVDQSVILGVTASGWLVGYAGYCCIGLAGPKLADSLSRIGKKNFLALKRVVKDSWIAEFIEHHSESKMVVFGCLKLRRSYLWKEQSEWPTLILSPQARPAIQIVMSLGWMLLFNFCCTIKLVILQPRESSK